MLLRGSSGKQGEGKRGGKRLHGPKVLSPLPFGVRSSESILVEFGVTEFGASSPIGTSYAITREPTPPAGVQPQGVVRRRRAHCAWDATRLKPDQRSGAAELP